MKVVHAKSAKERRKQKVIFTTKTQRHQGFVIASDSEAIQRKWCRDHRDFDSPYGLPEQVG
ncbi:MAG: hypothetical protein PHX61_01310 [Alphaproteobacteria bacterium]|nr:hypothetical protein [Alphaproteobacteria bacterium]